MFITARFLRTSFIVFQITKTKYEKNVTVEIHLRRSFFMKLVKCVFKDFLFSSFKEYIFDFSVI